MRALHLARFAKTDFRIRCAQLPYDTLPIPRGDIPEGVILSREADAWIREDEIPEVTFTDASGKPLKIKVENEDGKKEEIEVRGPAVALPLYEGRMIGQFDFSEKGWVSGKGRSAEWREIDWLSKSIEPQFVMAQPTFEIARLDHSQLKIGYMDVTSATNRRTMYSTVLQPWPCGNRVNILALNSALELLAVSSALNSFAFDFSLRQRLAGIIVNYFIAAETPLPRALRDASLIQYISLLATRLCAASRIYGPIWIEVARDTATPTIRGRWAVSDCERTRIQIQLEAVMFALFGFDTRMALACLSECDYPSEQLARRLTTLSPKGFWRVDKGKHAEHRYTVLTLIAFHDLMRHIEVCGGDRDKGIESFLNQNDGEGWMLPETLRLADYDLGHDDRAKEHQPVRAHFGPRFYDWQLAQTPEASWRECHLHARNLLGEDGYAKLLAEIKGRDDAPHDGSSFTALDAAPPDMLIDTEDAPLFRARE